MVLQSRPSRPLGFDIDSRLSDGTILRVERSGTDLLVEVETRAANAVSAGRYLTIRFHDATAVESVHPVGMLFCGLACWETGLLARRYEFSNCFQPGDDWDPLLAACRLEVTANSFSVSALRAHKE